MIHQNKIGLVTGGSRGLGRAIATQLARSGADVVLTYREKHDEADTVAAEIRSLGRRALALRLDVARTDTFAAFAAELRAALETTWGRPSFDFLVNNAGINRPAPFAETTEAAVDELFAVHFKGVFFLTQRLLPLLADGGRIVNLSTGLARFTSPCYAAYASMKGAVEVLTRYLAKELGARRIAVNTLAPGVIETDFTKETLSRSDVRDFLAGNIALGRVGAPDDIGGASICSAPTPAAGSMASAWRRQAECSCEAPPPAAPVEPRNGAGIVVLREVRLRPTAEQSSPSNRLSAVSPSNGWIATRH